MLNTIPHAKTDPPVKRFFLALIRAIVRIYVEVFRGTPMVLQAVFVYYGLPYFTDNAVQFDQRVDGRHSGGVHQHRRLHGRIRPGRHPLHRPRPDRGRQGHRHDPCADHAHVILPQALRNIMPQIGNNFIINVKDTSVMFIICFTDFFAAHRGVGGRNLSVLPLRGHGDGWAT